MVCRVHISVESWVGLAGDGLDVVTPMIKVVRGTAVVVKLDGPRPLRLTGFQWVTWLPEAPPPLGLVVVVVAVKRVLPFATVIVLGVGFPRSSVGVTVVVVVVVVVVVEVVTVMVSALLGIPLGFERKIGSWPILLASTKSVGT